MKVEIEKYRGHVIFFQTVTGNFTCLIAEDMAKDSKSFKAVKKGIDDYLKDNQNFKEFMLEPNPNVCCSGGALKIIGVRKDGRFVSQNEKGEKGQVSDYDLRNYMLQKDENIPLMNEIKSCIDEAEEFRKLNSQKRKEIESKLEIVTLEEVKSLLKNNGAI